MHAVFDLRVSVSCKSKQNEWNVPLALYYLWENYKLAKFPGYPLMSCFFFFVAAISTSSLFSPLASQQPNPPIPFTHFKTRNLG